MSIVLIRFLQVVSLIQARSKTRFLNQFWKQYAFKTRFSFDFQSPAISLFADDDDDDDCLS